MLKKGYFISVEGIDGSGKTTYIKKISKILKKKGVSHITTREPGGTKYSEKIRQLLANREIDPTAEVLAYASARRDHLLKVIKPALKKNKLVICDRFIDSSLVYQTIGKILKFEDVIKINQFAIGDYFPDLTFVLLTDPKDAQKRLFKNKKRELNYKDKKELSFHKSIDKGYKNLASKFPERIVYIDASISRKKEEVVNDVIKKIEKRIQRYNEKPKSFQKRLKKNL